MPPASTSLPLLICCILVASAAGSPGSGSPKSGSAGGGVTGAAASKAPKALTYISKLAGPVLGAAARAASAAGPATPAAPAGTYVPASKNGEVSLVNLDLKLLSQALAQLDGKSPKIAFELPNGQTVSLSFRRAAGGPGGSARLCAKDLTNPTQAPSCIEPQPGGAGGSICASLVSDDDDGSGRAFFTVCDGKWAGSIFDPAFRMFALEPAAAAGAADASSQYYLFEPPVDDGSDEDHHESLVAKSSAVPTTATPAETPGAGRRMLQSSTCTADSLETVNTAYLNVYVVDSLWSTTPRSIVENQLTITNSALTRAGAGWQLALLRFERVGNQYTRNFMNLTLFYLNDLRTGVWNVPDSAGSSAADFVMLVVPDSVGGPYDSAGIAWISARTSVVKRGYLDGLTFAHELGHNFGSYHNREVEQNPDPNGYAYAPWTYISAHSGTHPGGGAFSIMSYRDPCRAYNNNQDCAWVPQYGHNGDTVNIVAGGHGHIVAFGNALNDPGRIIRERRSTSINFDKHSCDRYWPDHYHTGYTSSSCWVPVNSVECNNRCNRVATCIGVDWYQGASVCCEIYGDAATTRFGLDASRGANSQWGRVFAKRKGVYGTTTAPGGVTCAPSLSTATGSVTNVFDTASFACKATVTGVMPTFTLRSNTTANRCIDIPGSSSADGVQLTQWECHGGANQAFALVATGDYNYYTIRTFSGKCFDVSGSGRADGTAVVQWPCTGGDNQKFALVPATTGGFTLRPKYAQDSCLDIAGGSTALGAKVQLWWCNNSAGQKFFAK